MSTISKSDLLYNAYKWSLHYTDDDPRITGIPDATLFNKEEGNEVLYFINKFAEKHGFGKTECMIAEHKIIFELPSEIKRQIDVQYWLEINWNK